MNNMQLPNTEKTSRFITSDRMVINILISTAVGLVVIATAVGLVGDNPAAVFVLLIAAIFDLGGILLVSRGYTLPGRILIPVILMFTTGYIAFNRGGLFHISMLGFPVIIVITGLLLGARGSFIFAAIGSIVSGVIGYAGINGLLPSPESNTTGYDEVAVAITLLFLTAFVLRVIIRRLTDSVKDAEEFGKAQERANVALRNLQGELEQRIEERTKELESRSNQLKTVASLARSVATIQDLGLLLPAITRSVSEQFGIYHVGIFLLDANKEFAVLKAANSPGGANMLARDHRLKVGEQGVVGFVAKSGNPRIALDVGADAVFFDNLDLPDTHSEVALPLRFGREIIGVLDLQSTQVNAFSHEDMDTLSILADQVALAIQNARSLERAQRALEEAEIASGQLTGNAWRGYTETILTKGYRYDGVKPEPLQMASRMSEEKDAFTIPVQLRGQIIGRLKLKSSDGSRTWTEDELAIIESTAERVALAMDGARLLDEAQKRAVRETFLSELAARLGTSTQLDSVLRDTVEELGEALKGSTVTFQLVNPSAPPPENQAAGGSARKEKQE